MVHLDKLLKKDFYSSKLFFSRGLLFRKVILYLNRLFDKHFKLLRVLIRLFDREE